MAGRAEVVSLSVGFGAYARSREDATVSNVSPICEFNHQGQFPAVGSGPDQRLIGLGNEFRNPAIGECPLGRNGLRWAISEKR